MPVSLPVTPQTMNYASVVFAGFASISIIWYFVRGRKEFSGPPVAADVSPEETDAIAVTRTGDEESDSAGKKPIGGDAKIRIAKIADDTI